jgi:peptide/nickel transport system substrate-binding protein
LEFDLRDDVLWHDGEKLDADDVIYTLNWGTNPDVKLRNKRDFDWIEKAEKLGPYKVRIIARVVTADDEATIASNIYILPQHVHGKYPPNETLPFTFKPVGSGPFIAAEVDKNKGAILKRYAGYKHGNSANPAAGVSEMHLLPIPDLSVQIAQYLAGNVDILVRITIDQLEELEKDKRNVSQLIQGGSVSYLAPDAAGYTKNKALKDPRVRKAMFMAMDRREYYILEAGNRTLNRGVPEGMCYKDQMGCDWSVKQPDFNIEGAKKLLAEAGYPNGFEVEMGTYTSAVQNHAVVAAGQLAKIGVRAKIEKYTIANFRNAMRDRKVEVFVGGFPIAGMPDVSGVLTSFFDVPESFDHHGDTEIKTLAQEMNQIVDPVKRREVGKKMFDLATERFYFMPLGPRPQSVVHNIDIDLKLSRYGTVGLIPGDIRWKK